MKETSDAILAGVKQKKRRTVILKSLFGLMSAAFVVTLLQFYTGERLLENRIDALSKSSEKFRNSNQPFEAMISALRARQLLLNKQLVVKSKTRIKVVAALKSALDQFRERNRLQGHNGAIISVSFSPNGKTIATASADNSVKLWKSNGIELTTLTGHKDWVRSVSFSPDGRTIATASDDKSVILWNLDLDELGVIACARIKNYLNNNHNLKESDQNLCN
ncbi:MAG: hypothetical protein F6K16_18745 [Symploca sp. SIO2B6]|nr:hypothetical protein [Symploca sp. SIO2B6]